MATFGQAVRRFATYAERLQAKQAAAEGFIDYLSWVCVIIVRLIVTIETWQDFQTLGVVLYVWFCESRTYLQR